MTRIGCAATFEDHRARDEIEREIDCKVVSHGRYVLSRVAKVGAAPR
jgi:hypothetical protein